MKIAEERGEEAKKESEKKKKSKVKAIEAPDTQDPNVACSGIKRPAPEPSDDPRLLSPETAVRSVPPTKPRLLQIPWMLRWKLPIYFCRKEKDFFNKLKQLNAAFAKWISSWAPRSYRRYWDEVSRKELKSDCRAHLRD